MQECLTDAVEPNASEAKLKMVVLLIEQSTPCILYIHHPIISPVTYTFTIDLSRRTQVCISALM